VATSELGTSSLHPAEIAAQRFPVARKGYAQEEVQRYLRLVAEHLSRLQGEIEWQRARGEHLERRSTAAQEAAYVRLSRDFMDVVRRADEAAGRVRADAEAQARAEVGSAEREAARLLAAAAEQAEMILTEARSEAERMLREARSQRSNGAEGPRPDPDPRITSEPDIDVQLDVSLLDLFGDIG
jgi:DivIVA domain-containing protein